MFSLLSPYLPARAALIIFSDLTEYEFFLVCSSAGAGLGGVGAGAWTLSHLCSPTDCAPGTESGVLLLTSWELRAQI